MRPYLPLTFLVALTLLPTAVAWAADNNWSFPQEISDQNTTIDFEVDSTWHLIHGSTSQISGRIWLEDSTDLMSIAGNIEIPIAQLHTGSSGRDSEMREVMHAASHPKIIYALKEIRARDPACRLQDVALDAAGKECPFTAAGMLTIAGNTRRIEASLQVTHAPAGLAVVGRVPLAWADYGVDDPSILVARLDSIVTVTFSTVIPLAPTAK